MKLGSYYVPERRNTLEILIVDIKKLYDVYQNDLLEKLGTNDDIAELLDYKSSNNGSYKQKLTAMKAYSLLEGAIDYYISSIAKDITYGTDENRKEGLSKAFLSIPLWKRLFKQFGRELPHKDLWSHLAKITGCDARTARMTEYKVIQAYRQDVELLERHGQLIPDDSSFRKSYTFGSQFEDVNLKSGIDNKSTLMIEIKAGTAHLQIPFDTQGKKIAMQFLEALEVQEERK